ncbi:unnamed protein product, partial [Rotaria magnacalcarata]
LLDELQKESVKRQLANILALPLLPMNKIIAAFYDASDLLITINRNFQTFVDYVEKTHMTAKTNIWKWIMHIQKDDEQTIIRLEPENKQKRSTQPRKNTNLMHDISLSNLKASYEQNIIDIKEYQRKIRVTSYSYINAFENNTTYDDND